MTHSMCDDLPEEKKRLVSVFKSTRKEEMYLYVDKKQGLTHIPDSLQEIFGKPQLVFDLLLSPNKKLARVSAREVLCDIANNGFFLQMPPPPAALSAVAKAREMMPAKGRGQSGHE